MTPSIDAGSFRNDPHPGRVVEDHCVIGQRRGRAVGGVALGHHAEQEISAVQRTYSPGDRIEVDLNRLRGTIKEVIKQAYLLNATVDAAAIKRVTSRYLWF